MATQRDKGPTDSVARPMCAHLRSKAMHVFENPGDHPNSDPMDEPCWCILTQHCVGPDDALVSPVECNSARNCFKAKL